MQTEQDVLSRKTEVDPKAYDYYLRGKQYFSVARYQQKELHIAEMMYFKAIELAPDFAQAYAELGCLYTEMYWHQVDHSQQLLDSAKNMIDIAMNLAPGKPEVHHAQGWFYYHGLRDFDRALAEFSRVIELQPNNALAIASISWVQRRQGKWGEAIDGLQTVTRLDPLDTWYKYELGITYHYCRRYKEAMIQFDKVIDLQPTNLWAYLLKSWTSLNQTGETREARGVLDTGRAYNGRWPELTWLEVYYDLCDKNYDHALSLMNAPGDVFFPENPDSTDYYSLKGFTYALMGRQQIARLYYDSARVQLESKLLTSPEAIPLLYSVAGVYAGLGRYDDAIISARRATELLPVSTDAIAGPIHIRNLAMIYAQAGLEDQAVELFDYLLTIPSTLSINSLMIAPEIALVRDDPRFRELVEKYK